MTCHENRKLRGGISPGRLAGVLQGRIRGEASADACVRRLYSHAACMYEIEPVAVAWPRDEEDVAEIVETCRIEGVSLTPRGAGSGVAGQALGSGVVVDFTRHMGRVTGLDAEEGLVRVQPGARLSSLNRFLAGHGKWFTPDPSSGAYCTIGGMMGNNAGGAHSVRYGSTRDHVRSLRAVTAIGELLEAGGANPAGGKGAGAGGAAGRLAAGLLGIAEGKRELIEAHTPRVGRNSSGYDLHGALRGAGVDLARLLVGSEGTLAVVTEACLRVRDLPRARATALALFGELAAAADGVVEALAERPSCLELVCEPLLAMARHASPTVRRAVPPSARAMVLVEADAGGPAEAAATLERIRRRIVENRRLAFSFHAVAEEAEREEIWAVRREATNILTAGEGSRRSLRFIEDACVPPDRLAALLEGVRAILSEDGVEAAMFGHAGDSLIHVNPLMDPLDSALRDRMEAIAARFTDLVLRLGGTLSGEHGDGRLRTPFLPRSAGPLYDLFGEVKRLFDPEGILNPGIVTGAGSFRMTDAMREGPSLWRAPETAN